MTLRKSGPFYDYWHRRVEGQIRDAMLQHPEWFTDAGRKSRVVNSIAKRIVGEIAVGVCKMPEAPGCVNVGCTSQDGED